MLGRVSTAINKSPRDGYNLWAENYDDQEDNLMLALDEEVFSGLLNGIDVENKIIADVGCGTGRHWQKLLDKKPQKITGFDVSEGMLEILKQKFPVAETHLLKNNMLDQLKNNSCDIIISTLTIAHIKNVEEAMIEWNRVLKPGGQIIITDYHPWHWPKAGSALLVTRTKSLQLPITYIQLEKLTSLAGQLSLEVLRLNEKVIDESCKAIL